MEFEEYLKSVEPIIYLIAKNNRIPGYEIEDVQQEIRLKIWENFNKYDKKLEKYKAGWVNKLSRNLIIDLNRYENRDKRKALNNYIDVDKLNI